MQPLCHNHSEQMLFALLRSSLHHRPAEENMFQHCTADDWTRCFQLAVGQGVMSLAWDGMKSLPSRLQPDMEVRIPWALSVENQENKYAYYCQTLQQLLSLFSSRSISAVILKGIGFSTYYSHPNHRECGDIDLYTYSTSPAQMSDAAVSQLADKLIQEQGIAVETGHEKHSEFFFQEVPVENHKTFVDLSLTQSAPALNRLLHQLLQPQITFLPGTAATIAVPSDRFNVLFAANHAFMHFYFREIKLHHLLDFATLVNRCGWHFDDVQLDKNFLRFVGALIHISSQLLDVQIDGPAVDEDYLRVVYREIMAPPYKLDDFQGSKFRLQFRKIEDIYYIAYIQSLVTSRCHSLIFVRNLFHALLRKIRKSIHVKR